MPNFNQVILIGHLTRAPELSYLKNSTQLCNCGIAVNEHYKSGNEWKEKTCFVDLVLFGDIAESFSKNCDKGSCVLVLGILQHDQWEDKNGDRRSKHKVNVRKWQFAQKRPQEEPQEQAEYDGPKGDDIPF